MPDRQGTALPDWHQARIRAIELAAELIRDGAKLDVFGEDWRMEVTDETGLILFVLDFHVAPAPAIAGAGVRQASV